MRREGVLWVGGFLAGFVIGVSLGLVYTWVIDPPPVTATSPAALNPADKEIYTVLIAAAYVTLYWLAGYYIAWQNPELRAFYGAPGEIIPFWTHTLATLRDGSNLFPFQFLRGLLWMLCTLPIIRGSKVNAWWTALLVGLLFSVPQNVGHILANPLMPIASVRLSHMIETASSTFIFGTLVVWLLHREHHSFADLIGIHRDQL